MTCCRWRASCGIGTWEVTWGRPWCIQGHAPCAFIHRLTEGRLGPGNCLATIALHHGRARLTRGNWRCHAVPMDDLPFHSLVSHCCAHTTMKLRLETCRSDQDRELRAGTPNARLTRFTQIPLPRLSRLAADTHTARCCSSVSALLAALPVFYSSSRLASRAL